MPASEISGLRKESQAREKKVKFPGGQRLSLLTFGAGEGSLTREARDSVLPPGFLPSPSCKPSPSRPLEEEGSGFLPSYPTPLQFKILQ